VTIDSQTRLVLLVGACALLLSLEAVWPLRRYRAARLRRALPNVALTVLVVLVNLALSLLVAAVSGIAAAKNSGLLAVISGVVVLDLATYAAHVAMHRSAFAWRFHRVHHSDAEVDVTTAFRQHPGETLWRVAWQLPPIVLFGIPFGVVVLYLTLSTLNAQLEHANLRLSERVDCVVRWIFVTPNMHKVHHSRLQPETDSNYSNIFSLWDRLFGTYTRRADLAQLRYGLDGCDEPATQSFRGLLRLPFASVLASLVVAASLWAEAPKRTVLFMCPYGGAKSVIAMSYFNRLAERDGLPYRAAAVAAETPYDAVPEKVAAFLSSEGFAVDAFKPQHVAARDFESAARVVSIDCDLAKVETRDVAIERWDDVPKVSVDLPASAAAIRKHVETLVEELGYDCVQITKSP
jgi:sterol desaturase/sphingolipid hydroxylase (fatty acid hydroxylase superfamily)/protein-tyrosine-phosphatase